MVKGSPGMKRDSGKRIGGAAATGARGSLALGTAGGADLAALVPPGRRRWRTPLLVGPFVVLAFFLVSGCAGRQAPLTPADPDAAPWEVPSTAVGTQRLYRVGYDGPDGGGSFRLTLSLAAPERYRVRAVDPVGRALWSLDVDGEEGLWVDHRAEAACRLAGSLDLAAGRLTPFPLASLPALLLGRLPASPAGEVEEPGAGEAAEEPEAAAAGDTAGRRLAFADAQGRRWSATLGDDGAPRSWAMTEPGDAAPSVWWRRRGGDGVLSDRVRGIQLTWSQSVVEPLPEALAPLAAPPSFHEVPCEVLYAAPPADSPSAP